MPRSVRDSDEDMETRTGRKTRAGAGAAVPESPVRRSSRNKQFTKQNDSSQDFPITETSSALSTRSFRSRAGTIDSNSLEIQRRLRSNKNTVDTMDTKESELSTEPQTKKITRRSIAVINTPESAKTTRTRRLTRAGSETKSTPTGRMTRKTRASSMDPESTIEQPIKDTQLIDTPSRKRRASILPSQKTVIEEEEKQVPRVVLEKTLIEEDESATNVSPQKAVTSDKMQESSDGTTNEEHETIDRAVEEKDFSVQGPVHHSSKSDHMEISDNIMNEEPITEAKSSISQQSSTLEKDKNYGTDENVMLTKDITCNISTDSTHNLANISKEAELKNENVLHVSLEEGEINTSDKDNEYLNTSNSLSKQNKNESTLNVSKEEGELNTSNKENECANIDSSVFAKNKSNIKKLNQEASLIVLDTSTQEDKNAQFTDDIKLDNTYLSECSVSILKCDHLIRSPNKNNEIQKSNLFKENNSVSVLDAKEAISTEKQDHDNTQTTNDKNNTDSIIEVEKSDTLNIVSQQILNEEEKIPKEQSKLNNSINDQMENNAISQDESNSKSDDLNADNTEKIYCDDEMRPEVNDSVISNNASSVSVNPKENLMDISVTDDNCAENMKVTEVSDINNDINQSTISKDSHVIQDNISSTSENQNSMIASDHDLPIVTLQVSDDSVEEPANNTEQTELCLVNLESPKHSSSIPETNDSSIVAESHDVPEEDLPDDEGCKRKSSLETLKISEIRSITELNTSKTGVKEQENDVQNVEEDDIILKTGLLFQDIAADEWKQKHRNFSENENSVHSTSTVKLGNDSETECDLVLVDKEAWLAAENIKTAKTKESFDYDSDDTVVLKSKMDYLNDKRNKSNEVQKPSKDSERDNDIANTSELSPKKDKSKLNEERNVDECDVNVSLQNTSKRKKSLNKTGDAHNISKNDSVKSSSKKLEDEDELIEESSKDHDNSQNKLTKSPIDKKQNKNRSLNSSSNKKNKLKQGSNKYNRLHISSSEEDEVDSLEDDANVVKSNVKKESNKNYSTVVHIGSDTDSNSTDSTNNDTRNKSIRIPRFLFKNKDSEESSDESNEAESSKGSIDSDINAEYNLDGKTIGKFSDDDIPGDECRASESESSDPDDNGSDLADFVVDDDEVEEEEEEEEEENENENENENVEEEQEKEEEESENENVEEEQEKEGDEIENENVEEEQEKEEEMKDEIVTDNENENEKTKSKDVVSRKEKNKDTSNKSLNVSNIKSDKKKIRNEKISLEVHSGEPSEDEAVSNSKVNASIKSDTTLSEKKKKKKQKLNENDEIMEETPKRNLNESEVMFMKKAKRASASLTSSTPKTDTHQHEQFKHNISSEKKKRKYIEKTSVNNEEKICLKDSSSDNSDDEKVILNTSENAKAGLSAKNISTSLLENINTNTSKPLLFKKRHLNKTLSPTNETPTTKYLKIQKLNESAPFIKLEESKGTSSTDKKKKIAEENETSTVIIEQSIGTSSLDSSFSTKRKRSMEVTDLGDRTEINDNVESHVVSNNERKNPEVIYKVDGGRKKNKKKSKKNKNFEELDILDADVNIIEESIENDKEIETSITKSKKNKKRNKSKSKENIKDENKIIVEPSNANKKYKKGIEVEDIPNKKKKKITSEIVSQQVKEQSKKSRKNVSKGVPTSSNVKLSDRVSENTEFSKLKFEALEAATRAREIIRANKNMKTYDMEMKKSRMEPTIITTSSRGIKRYSSDNVDNFPDVQLRPLKKQKLSQKPGQAASHVISKYGFEESNIVKVNKNNNLSSCGSTTEFDVVSFQKTKKQLKKNPAVVSFRQKMLSRNSRYPVTNYLMYLQKQKACGHTYAKQS